MRRTIIFFIKILVASIPVIIISLYARYNLFDFADQEIPYYIWNKDFCNSNHENGYETVILGDSVANAAYMPEVLSDSTINLSMGGATPAENYYVMLDYLKNNKAPSNVFISFMDLNLQQSNCFWKRCMYSHRFTIGQNIEILQNAKKYDEQTIAIENSTIEFLEYELYMPSKYITALSKANISQRKAQNEDTYKSNDLHGGRYIGRNAPSSQPEAIEYDEFYLSPLFEYYYKQLIQLCDENNIKVHIVKIPMPNNSTFSEEYKNQVEDYYKELKAEYPTITFNWISDKYDTSYFYDYLHMNDRGALRFSLEIKDMFPEAFDNEFSEHQIAAINDNIQNEDKLEELYEWSTLQPYELECNKIDEDEIEILITKKSDGLVIADKIFEHVTDDYYILRE